MFEMRKLTRFINFFCDDFKIDYKNLGFADLEIIMRQDFSKIFLRFIITDKLRYTGPWFTF